MTGRAAIAALVLLSLGGCDYVTWEYVWRHWTRPEPTTTFVLPTKLPPPPQQGPPWRARGRE